MLAVHFANVQPCVAKPMKNPLGHGRNQPPTSRVPQYRFGLCMLVLFAQCFVAIARLSLTPKQLDLINLKNFLICTVPWRDQPVAKANTRLQVSTDPTSRTCKEIPPVRLFNGRGASSV